MWTKNVDEKCDFLKYSPSLKYASSIFLHHFLWSIIHFFFLPCVKDTKIHEILWLKKIRWEIVISYHVHNRFIFILS